MDNKARIMEVLAAGHLMSLATIDENGLWVADVIYVFDDDLTLYWMSEPGVRHSRALDHEARVAGSITVSNKSKEPNFGIQFAGTAKKIDGSQFALAKKHFAKRGHPEPAESDDVLNGRSWYALRPSAIDLIDEANLGFEKRAYVPVV